MLEFICNSELDASFWLLSDSNIEIVYRKYLCVLEEKRLPLILEIAAGQVLP